MTLEEQPGGDPALSAAGSIDVGVRVAGSVQWYRAQMTAATAGSPSITVLWPPSISSEAPLSEGQHVLLRRSTEDAQYTAEASVESAAGARAAVTLRASSWERIQRRDDVRQPVGITPTRLEVVRGEVSSRLAGEIRNVSGGGLLLRTVGDVHVGDIVDVEFALPDRDPIQARVRVQRVDRRTHHNRLFTLAGCSYQQINEADRARIVRFIFTEQRKVARRLAGT